VAVIGGGQSALECAALLQEAGAQVEIVARQRSIHFLVRSKRLHSLGLLSRLLYAPADVGPAGISRIVAAPAWYQKLPPRLQDKWRARSIRPAGASWLVPRLTDVRATTGVHVVSTSLQDDALTLFLSDGTRRTVDHAVLSTGYAVDVSRYPFFPPDLVKAVEMRGGYPRLSSSFESTVPGLYFIGAPAMWSFGPLMHFVAGADYTARRLASAMGAAVA
jgi:hypothetical protein